MLQQHSSRIPSTVASIMHRPSLLLLPGCRAG
jgi:hypothetical protein